MSGHVIVCGEDPLALRIIDELGDADMNVVHLRAAADLAEAGVTTAHAVVCASADDALNLELALLAHRINPQTRVVARLANPVLRQAMSDGTGSAVALDVADLAGPSVVEALLGRTAHTIAVGAMDFVVSAAVAPRDATLRELYGRLAPVAVVGGEDSPQSGGIVACPPLDAPVRRGDWVTMIGRPAEFAEQGIPVGGQEEAGSPRRSRTVRVVDALRAFHDDLNPMFYRALAVAAMLLLGSTVLLRFAFREPRMGWVDALSFATETLTTVGYGDFNFLEQPTWLRLWGVVMMLAGFATNAILVAFIADALLSQRLSQSASRQRVSHLRDHFVVVGAGSFGMKVAGLLRDAGHDVVAIERNEAGRYLPEAAELGVPVILGDATVRTTLAAARAEHARAVAVLTEDDVVNIETGIVLREMIGPREAGNGPIVLRIYDQELGAAVGHWFGFRHVRSTVDLSLPWFIGAAMGLEVLGTFSVGQRSFMVGGVRIAPGSELDGIRVSDLSTQTRVLAVLRNAADTELHPRRETVLHRGDTAYLVGPYHELLDALRRGSRSRPSAR